jgi:hypothetical protein
MDPKGKGRKISDIGSNYPVLADNRTLFSNPVTSHFGRGFNVTYGDGSVDWLSVSLIGARGAAAGIVSSHGARYSTHWGSGSVAVAPNNPALDPDLLGTTSTLMQTGVNMRTFNANTRYSSAWYVFYLLRN